MFSPRWLGVRLEFLGNCLVLGATLFSIFSDLNGAIVGLSITYALQVHTFPFILLILVFSSVKTNIKQPILMQFFFCQATGILNLLVVNFSDLANNIVCVERIKEYYTDVASEVGL